ncbi:hypothetical protein ABIB25_005855 [Nakamurella sp. UYEF19]
MRILPRCWPATSTWLEYAPTGGTIDSQALIREIAADHQEGEQRE